MTDNNKMLDGRLPQGGLPFVKMHGAGNDYVYVDLWKTALDEDMLAPLAVAVSDRHKGIGADGLITIGPAPAGSDADAMMRIFNADGSEGRMCGNGLRCTARLLSMWGRTATHDTAVVDTLAGRKIARIHFDDCGEVVSVTVDMGLPAIGGAEAGLADPDQSYLNRAPEGAAEWPLTAVGMGNPHGVTIVDRDPGAIDIERPGRQLEHHPMWADRANIEFVWPAGPSRLKMRVWERGSGETMACGTGACAAAVAASTLGVAGRSVDVELPGGTLHIDWSEEDGHVYLTGDAVVVFEGIYRPC